MTPRRCGYAVSWGVSISYMLQRIAGADHSPYHSHQVFQDYYQNVLLKGTSPSTMCVLFLPILQ